MKYTAGQKGFTLLEIIIVIVIIGILASLALARMRSTIQFSHSAEALQQIGVIRNSIERCYLMTRTYASCSSFDLIDTDDPSDLPNTHFTYALPGTFSTSNYAILATRNTRDGGNSGDWVRLDSAAGVVSRSGSGAFSSIQ